MERHSSIELLLSLNWDKPFDCIDIKEKCTDKALAIANAPLPEHELICHIPREYKSQLRLDSVRVKIHIIWLETNTSSRFLGLVMDKADLKLYFVSFCMNGEDSDTCEFLPADEELVLKLADIHNPYLRRVWDMYGSDPASLLDFQLYTPFTDRFFYIELPFEDRVSMCAAGLNDNRFWAVGWLGKLINKDFYVSYAECTHEAYEHLKRQYPTLYERAFYMKRNRNYFLYFNEISDKRKNHTHLADILLKLQKDPKSTREGSVFRSSVWGTKMWEYNGPALRFTEDFLIACIKFFHGIR